MNINELTENENTFQRAYIKIAKGGIYLLFGEFIFKAFGFFRQFSAIRMLSAEQYGLFILGLTLVNIIIILSNLGLAQGSQRYISYYRAKGDLGRVKGIIHFSIKLAGGTSLILFTCLFLFSGYLSHFFSKPDLSLILKLFSLSIPFAVGTHMIISFFLGYHIARFRIILRDFGEGLLSFVLVLIGLLISTRTTTPVLAMVLAFFLVFLVSLFCFFKYSPVKLSKVKAVPIGRPLVKFSIPLLITNLLYLIMANLDTIMIGYFLPSEQVGYYNAAFLLMQFIPIFLISFSTIYMPIVSSLLANNLYENIKGLYRYVTKWVFLITIPLLIIFIAFPSQTLSLLFGNIYSEAASALIILSCAEFLHIFLGPNDNTLIAYGKSRILFFSSVTATLVNISLNWFLIPRIGISGAAIATALALATTNILNSLYLYIKHKIHPFNIGYLVPVLISILTCVLSSLPLSLLIRRSSWWILLCYPLFLIFVMLTLILAGCFTEEDLELGNAIIKKLRSIIGWSRR